MRKMSRPVRAASSTKASVTFVGYGRVAHGVAAAQQHLERDVGHRLAQQGEPLPRVLAEEAQRDVVGRAAPGLHREQLGGEPRDVPATCSRSRVRIRVASSDWWASRKVVSVTATSVRSRSCRANSSGPTPQEQVAGAGRHGGVAVDARAAWARRDAGARRAVRLVDRDVGEVGEQPGAAVGRASGR